MLLYALDELFYVFDQVKWQWGMDKKIVVAYEILCLSALQCTEWWHGTERTGMPDALSLLNMNDACHLKHLVWAVYDGALLVGRWPELPENCLWCTVPACTSTSTGATRTWPTAHHTRWPPGIARRGLRHCIEGAGSVPCGVASGEHPGPGGDPGAALDATPRCWPRGIGMDAPMAHPLVRHQGATAGQPYPLTPCPSWPQLSTFHPMPGPATPAGEWPRLPSMMKMHGRMTSKSHTCQSVA